MLRVSAKVMKRGGRLESVAGSRSGHEQLPRRGGGEQKETLFTGPLTSFSTNPLRKQATSTQGDRLLCVDGVAKIYDVLAR